MANQPTCHAMLVKKRGIPCRCIGKYFNQKDGNHYCGKHFNKTKNREFKLINTLTSSVPDCGICLEPINATDRTYKTVCMHTFHENCFNQLKNDGGVNCPQCERCILWDWQDDPVAKEFKRDRERYAGFQMWCIQKKMGLKFIKSPEKNREYCTYAQVSLTLNREMKKFDKMSPEILFDKLMVLCRDHSSVLT